MVATPGSELALRLLPVVLSPLTVAIASPTYSSHADAWRQSGTEVTETPLQAIEPGIHDDAVVIVNPNNPDGTLLSRNQVLKMHDALHARGGWLVVDEAFIDVDPENSMCHVAGTAQAPNLIALRSFGKFYGLAGVRLGFAVCSPRIVALLRGLIGEWPLSADALAAGIAAYTDTDWARKMRTQLLNEARQLDDLLSQSGMTVLGGTTLFRLARHCDAPRLVRRFLSAGILVRPFAHDPALLRFGLPGTAVAWRRLASALRL